MPCRRGSDWCAEEASEGGRLQVRRPWDSWERGPSQNWEETRAAGKERGVMCDEAGEGAWGQVQAGPCRLPYGFCFLFQEHLEISEVFFCLFLFLFSLLVIKFDVHFGLIILALVVVMREQRAS